MLFLSVVQVPVLKREPFASQKVVLFRAIAGRFRAVVWGAVTILVFTRSSVAASAGDSDH